MAIYYRFMSARDYCTMPLLQHHSFITLSSFKRRVFESHYKAKKDLHNNNTDKTHDHLTAGFCMGTDCDLLVINAQTNEVYADDDMLISRNTSVLLRRVPGNRRRQPIDTTPIVILEAEVVQAENKLQESNSTRSTTNCNKSDAEWDDFGEDLFAVPDRVTVQSTKQPATDACEADDNDEDSKIRALVNTPALDNYFIPGVGSRWTNAGGYSRGGGFKFRDSERKMPPEGYVCHRCNKPGHFIQDCPTNGDPSYDFKRVRRPVGIPRSMLMTNPDGCYKLPGGATAVWQPDEDAFDKAMEGLSSASSSSSRSTVVNVPPELHCPLCKQVMKDAVLIKCCFQSFCDKCIRDHIITSKLKCVCGAANVLIDDLLPNITLRDTIMRVLDSDSSSRSSSSINAGSASSSVVEQTANAKDVYEKDLIFDTNQIAKKRRIAKATDVSEAKPDLMNVKSSMTQDGTKVMKETFSLEAGRKNRKRTRTASRDDYVHGSLTSKLQYVY